MIRHHKWRYKNCLSAWVSVVLKKSSQREYLWSIIWDLLWNVSCIIFLQIHVFDTPHLINIIKIKYCLLFLIFLNCLNYQYIVLKIFLCHNTNTWIDEHIIYNIAYEFDIFKKKNYVILFSVVATFDSLCLSSVVWPNFPAFIVTILFLCTNLHLLLHPRKTGYLPLNPRDPGKMLTVPSVNACTECVKKKIQC